MAADGADEESADLSAGAELARLYDLDLADHSDDVELYLALAGRGHLNILELGCGSGRIAIPLAAAGHDVVGVDHDASTLARASAAWQARPRRGRAHAHGDLKLIGADVTELDLGRRFDLVICGLNLLPALPDRTAQDAALKVCGRHVEPDRGRLVIDLSIPSAAELAAWDGSLVLAWQRLDPDSGDQVAKLWSTEYDAATEVAVVTTFFDRWPAAGGAVRRVARRDVLHLLSASELRSMVGRAGFTVVQAATDYAMTPFGAGGERAVLVCSLL